MSVLFMLLQVVVLAVLAPLVAGVIKNTKGKMQSRRGPGYFQVYYDLRKFFKKDNVFSPTVSWIFKAAPYIYFATALGAAALVPTLLFDRGLHYDNIFVLIYMLGLGRFFLALASLDAGSSFGGMGGSREMFINILVEPVLMLTLFTVALRANGTGMSQMASASASSGISLSAILAAIAFLILTVAETGRIPVDNPDTHLELTMVHEGMVLEYCGRSVGLIFWGSALKQLVTILLMVNFFLPWNPAGSLPPVVWMILKVLVIAVVLAGIETSTNKMRLFRLPGLLIATGCLSLLAIIAM
ncbi:MAG TPA: formate hydrogenlyase [Desulfosporosinus sp.]|nr:formate hydrogenlyase [Desulfosporosinus sp.]